MHILNENHLKGYNYEWLASMQTRLYSYEMDKCEKRVNFLEIVYKLQGVKVQTRGYGK